MKIFKLGDQAIVEHGQQIYKLSNVDWKSLLGSTDVRDTLESLLSNQEPAKSESLGTINAFDPPLANQEVWAAGVTYLRSKVEREKESEKSGGAVFYDKVYEADRPEIFFKSSPARVVGHGADMYIRRDSTWDVPEAELTLLISPRGEIQGYTIGNDLSSRSIEGENPLYLPQAKTWDKSAALGPCLWLPDEPFSTDTEITCSIARADRVVYKGETHIRQMKRTFDELISYLFSEVTFPYGCYLMTGTGVVPPENFTLQPGDRVDISIEGIGLLTNGISRRP